MFNIESIYKPWEANFEYCYYSKRLLNKLLILNNQSVKKINITEVKKAIYFAKKYHSVQKRQTGEPYYSHPLEVAYMVADYRFKTDLIVTSILHDTIEDTILTKENIESLFNSHIANQVESLTRLKKDRKIESSKMVQSLLQQKQDDLLLIKYFDRLHNMQTIKVKSPKRIKQITNETIEVFLSLVSHLKIRKKEKNLLIKFCGCDTRLKDTSVISHS